MSDAWYPSDDDEQARRNGHAYGGSNGGGYAYTGEPRRPEWNVPPSPRAEPFGVMPIGKVPDEGPVKWLVRDLWLAEGVGIIGGEPKTFKSFCSAQLATCVAAGAPMFGRHEVERGRVLMYNAEDRAAMTRDRVGKMCRALGVDIATLDLALVDVPALRLDDPAQMVRLARTIADYKPRLLILDPLRDLHGLDENDARLMSALLVPLRVIQREHHCAVALVHHMAKLTETQRRPGQRLRGSSAMHGWIDSGLYLTLKEGGSVVVDVEHRSAPSPERFAFTVESSPTSNGTDALWLQPETVEGDDMPEEDGDAGEPERNAVADNLVISALQGASGLMTGRDLRKACRQRAAVTMAALRGLIRSGVVTEEPYRKGRTTVPGYRLTRGV